MQHVSSKGSEHDHSSPQRWGHLVLSDLVAEKLSAAIPCRFPALLSDDIAGQLGDPKLAGFEPIQKIALALVAQTLAQITLHHRVSPMGGWSASPNMTEKIPSYFFNLKIISEITCSEAIFCETNLVAEIF